MIDQLKRVKIVSVSGSRPFECCLHDVDGDPVSWTGGDSNGRDAAYFRDTDDAESFCAAHGLTVVDEFKPTLEFERDDSICPECNNLTREQIAAETGLVLRFRDAAHARSFAAEMGTVAALPEGAK